MSAFRRRYMVSSSLRRRMMWRYTASDPNIQALDYNYTIRDLDGLMLDAEFKPYFQVLNVGTTGLVLDVTKFRARRTILERYDDGFDTWHIQQNSPFNSVLFSLADACHEVNSNPTNFGAATGGYLVSRVWTPGYSPILSLPLAGGGNQDAALLSLRRFAAFWKLSNWQRAHDMMGIKYEAMAGAEQFVVPGRVHPASLTVIGPGYNDPTVVTGPPLFDPEAQSRTIAQGVGNPGSDFRNWPEEYPIRYAGDTAFTTGVHFSDAALNVTPWESVPTYRQQACPVMADWFTSTSSFSRVAPGDMIKFSGDRLRMHSRMIDDGLLGVQQLSFETTPDYQIGTSYWGGSATEYWENLPRIEYSTYARWRDPWYRPAVRSARDCGRFGKWDSRVVSFCYRGEDLPVKGGSTHSGSVEVKAAPVLMHVRVRWVVRMRCREVMNTMSNRYSRFKPIVVAQSAGSNSLLADTVVVDTNSTLPAGVAGAIIGANS